jgi:DNA-binding transcriptional MerR regulator
MNTTEHSVQGTLFETNDPAANETIGYRGPTVCQIAHVSYRQLDYWTRTNLIQASVTPAAGSGSQRLYSFRDILLVKIIGQLLKAGISLQNVRKALTEIREREVSELASLTLFSDGTTIYECRSADEVVDLLAGGQGVFGIAVPGLVAELTGDIAEFPAQGADPAVAGDELAARRAAKTA